MNALREQIRSLLNVEAREHGYRAWLNVDPKLSVFPDHFPNYPLLPGICLIQAVVIAAAIRQGIEDFRVRYVKNAKLMQPVLPGDQIAIDADMTASADGDFLIKAKCSKGDVRCAEFSLVAGPEGAPK